MSDVIVILQNALEQAFSLEVYPVEMPNAPEFPLIVLTKVSGRDEQDFDGDTLLEEARVQVDVYQLGYAACIHLAGQVRNFIVSRPPPGPPCAIDRASCINDTDLPAPEFRRAGPLPVRRRVLEFTIWTRRA